MDVVDFHWSCGYCVLVSQPQLAAVLCLLLDYKPVLPVSIFSTLPVPLVITLYWAQCM
jgi:hypothetical protein